MTSARFVLAALAGAAFLAGAFVQVAVEGRPRYRPLPVEMDRGRSRMDLTGLDISRAGAVFVRVDAELLDYRQTCRGACDQVLIDFETLGEGLYRVSAQDASGAAVFSRDVYVDGHMSNGVSAGPDGRLTLTSLGLRTY